MRWTDKQKATVYWVWTVFAGWVMGVITGYSIWGAQ